jgi:hypothetical protein
MNTTTYVEGTKLTVRALRDIKVPGNNRRTAVKKGDTTSATVICIDYFGRALKYVRLQPTKVASTAGRLDVTFDAVEVLS